MRLRQQQWIGGPSLEKKMEEEVITGTTETLLLVTDMLGH